MPTIVELKKLAKSRGLKDYSKLNKSQLESLLLEPEWKKLIFGYTLYVNDEINSKKHLSQITKNTKFTGVGNEFNNKTISQIKTLAYQKLRRKAKNVYPYSKVIRKHYIVSSHEIMYYFETVIDGTPVELAMKFYVEKAKSLEDYHIIQKQIKNQKTQHFKSQKTLTELALKKAKLSNQLPEELYEKVREKKFKRVMRQI